MSLARLRNRQALDDFKELFAQHGALGEGRPARRQLTEIDVISLVPLVFGLLPVAAMKRPAPGIPVRPAIRAHLAGLGVAEDRLLEDILKSVADQWAETWKVNLREWGTSSRVKYQIGNVKGLYMSTYRKLAATQNSRCRICGVQIPGPTAVETLDHIVPWRLIGDVVDGSNWQLLCQTCNSVKGSWLAGLQLAESLNWVYEDDADFSAMPSRRTKYVVLARDRCCSRCGVDASAARLVVIRRQPTGLAVADNLEVRCENHARREEWWTV